MEDCVRKRIAIAVMGLLLVGGTAGSALAQGGGSANGVTDSGGYLDVYSGGIASGASIAGAGWEYSWGGGSALTGAFTQTGAFALPATSRDSALLVTLSPGSYTAQVSGAGGTTGIALVELYEMP